jgi:hypothetical protein
MVNTSKRRVVFALAASLAAVAGAGVAMGQQQNTLTAIPRFTVLPAVNAELPPAKPTLPTWTYDWTYAGTSYSATVVGSAPAGDVATTIPVFLIPIKLRVDEETFTPETLQANGKSAIRNTELSPLFKHITFEEADTDLGDTQYIDAYQRANFWSSTSTNTGWHTLFGTPTVLPTQTIHEDGSIGVEFGVTAALVELDSFDSKVQKILKAFPQITADSIPIFIVYDTYLTDGGECCIGGYHSYTGKLAYSVFSYVGTPGAFAEDVAALSHELAEIVMDPLTNNNSPCGILEVADPLEGEANYGTYPYVRDDFTYHLQDITFITYFGAPATTSLASRTTFQGTSLGVCANGS